MTARGVLAAFTGRLAAAGLVRVAIAIAVLQLSIVGLVGGLAVQAGPREPFIGDWMNLQTPRTDPLSELVAPTERWDGLWYQHIARDGYADLGSGAFFPLFPMAGRLMGLVLRGNFAVGLVFVACVAYVVALVLLGRLAIFETERLNERQGEPASHLDPPSVAIVAMLTLAAFPTGFFFVGPFTESLFLVFAIGTLLAVRQGRFWPAIVPAALASLTRVQGVFLAAPIAWEAVQAAGILGSDVAFRLQDLGRPGTWLHLGWARVRAVIPGFLAAAAPVVTLAAWYAALGSMLGPSAVGTSAQTPWGFQITPAWSALAMSVTYVAAHWPHPISFIEGFNAVAILGSTALVVIGRRLPVAYLLYVVPSIVLVADRVQWMMPLMSASRYVLALFPLFLVLAVILIRRPRLALGWLAVSTIVQLVLVQWFARWGFVA